MTECNRVMYYFVNVIDMYTFRVIQLFNRAHHQVTQILVKNRKAEYFILLQYSITQTFIGIPDGSEDILSSFHSSRIVMNRRMYSTCLQAGPLKIRAGWLLLSLEHLISVSRPHRLCLFCRVELIT